MGMSASQARLIALTARMSDVEYEGQQINQQRLTLSNKISDIYAQMEAIQVPTPPSPQDFMVPAYKGKDSSGNNITVQQNENGGFDYYKDVTGRIAKEGGQLTVQKGRPLKGVDFDISTMKDTAHTYTSVGDDFSGKKKYITSGKVMVVDPTQLYEKTGVKKTTDSTEKANYDSSDVKATKWKGTVPSEDTEDELGGEEQEFSSLEAAQAASATGIEEIEWEVPTFARPTTIDGSKEYFSDQYGKEGFQLGASFVLKNEAKEVYKAVDGGFELSNETIQHGGEYILGFDSNPGNVTATAYADKLDASESELKGVFVVGEGNPPEVRPATAADVRDPEPGAKFIKEGSSGKEYIDTTSDEGALNIGGRTTYMSVGEAEAAGISSEAFADAIAGLKHSFPSDGAGYDWDKDFGVLVGKDGAIQFFVKPQDGKLTNGMEVDIYNPGTGTYKEKVGDSQTNGSPSFDGTGQPKSVNIGGQAVELSVEKELDEVAYQSKQAEYTRAKNQYDAEQDALNRKTSTYQMEDKKLDLKLKRLDTERNALNTEIDAVKKVIQDATDKGFKTFSG